MVESMLGQVCLFRPRWHLQKVTVCRYSGWRSSTCRNPADNSLLRCIL